MDATAMTEADTALLRARLHLRGGKRRLQEGLTTAGIVALYDSVLFGMRYYIARHKGCASFVESADLWDAVGLFHALVQAGVFDDAITFNRFSLNVERALWQKTFSFDIKNTVIEIESILMKLGVMPVNETALPGESLSNQ
jgi:hypothetical protein